MADPYNQLKTSADLIKLNHQESVSRIAKAIQRRLYALHMRGIPVGIVDRHAGWIDLDNKATRQAVRIAQHIREVMFVEERDLDAFTRRGRVIIYFDDGITITNNCEIGETKIQQSYRTSYDMLMDITNGLLEIDEDMAVLLLLKYGGDDNVDTRKGGPP